MPNFSRAEQNKQGQLHPAQLVLRALIGLILLAALLPLRQVNAAPAGADPLDMLIYKEYGNPDTTLQNMPPPCEGGDECDADTTDFYKPFGTMTEAALAAGSRSDMVEVTTTEMWPFAPTVKLFSYWPSGEMTTCSGMMVDARVTLTAGSCVYTHDPALCSDGDSACWVTDVSAVPAYTDGEAPFGQSGYESIMTWTDWTEVQNPAFDLAAIRLRYPIGETTGWLGVGFNNEDTTFTNSTLTNTAYPQDAPYNGESMYGWEGAVTDADSSDDIFYINGNCDTGRVGASLNGQDGVAYGTFSHSDLALGTGITRITYSKFDSLRTFIQEGQPKDDGGDLIPFDVRAEPKTIFPDQKLSEFSFYLQNYSSSPISFNSYQVDVYLSSDPFISPAEDHLLHSFTYEGEFSPNQGLRVTLPEGEEIRAPGEIHGSEPLGGTFYLGVTVSGGGENPDNDGNNRSEYQQPEPVWVYDSDNNTYFLTIWFR